MRFAVFLVLLICLSLTCLSQTAWQANLDSSIRFYQTTDFGIVLAGGLALMLWREAR